MEFLEQKHYKLAPSGHALSDGHKAWAEYLYENLKDKFTLQQSKLKMI